MGSDCYFHSVGMEGDARHNLAKGIAPGVDELKNVDQIVLRNIACEVGKHIQLEPGRNIPRKVGKKGNGREVVDNYFGSETVAKNPAYLVDAQNIACEADDTCNYPEAGLEILDSDHDKRSPLMSLCTAPLPSSHLHPHETAHHHRGTARTLGDTYTC